MPHGAKKAPRSNNKKKNRGAKPKKVDYGYLPPVEELIEHFYIDEETGKFCRDGKEVLVIEELYDKSMEMIASIVKEKKDRGEQDPGWTLRELKLAMGAKYWFDVDVLNCLLKDYHPGDGRDINQEKAPIQAQSSVPGNISGAVRK